MRASAHVLCKCLHADMHMVMHSYQCVWAEVVTVHSNVTVSMLTLLTALHAILSERKTDRLETKTDRQVQFISSDLLHGLMGSNPCCLVTNYLPCISKTSPMRSVSSNDGMLTLLCKFMHPMFSHSHMLGSLKKVLLIRGWGGGDETQERFIEISVQNPHTFLHQHK